jgi:hypothetical protein
VCILCIGGGKQCLSLTLDFAKLRVSCNCCTAEAIDDISCVCALPPSPCLGRAGTTAAARRLCMATQSMAAHVVQVTAHVVQVTAHVVQRLASAA